MRIGGMAAYLLLAVSLSFAQDGTYYTYDQSQGELSDFLYNYGIAIALVVSYIVVALGFMAANIFSSREIEAWSKVELREAFLSTLFVCLAVSLIPVFNTLVDSFFAAPQGSGSQKMYTYTDVFSNVIDSAFSKVIQLSLFMAQAGIMSGISWVPTAFNSALALVNWSTSLYITPQSVYSIVYLFGGIFSPVLIMGIFSIAAQYAFIVFLEKSLYVFLGLAIFLRAFVFTRRMGSTLFGIFLGGFIFLKLALVIEASVYSNLAASGQMANPESASVLEGMGNIISPIGKFFNMFIIPKYILDFCQWFDTPCDKAPPPWNYSCYVLAWTYCGFIGLFIVWPFDLIATAVHLLLEALLTVKMILEVILLGPGHIGLEMADKISTQIAVSSDVLVLAYFLPFFNVLFALAGITALVQALGGDESVVNMLTFI
ncbi:MAG: hypothetical protein N3G76_02655 [Candidatus Micrarchaeota archaeon]|nr:hypothetical protein [Candidatus Micrarchaeota archaeon]